MRGTLRGVRTRVERLVADMQRRSQGIDWELQVAMLQEGRQRAREQAKNPGKRSTPEENIARGRALRARLREAGYL